MVFGPGTLSPPALAFQTMLPVSVINKSSWGVEYGRGEGFDWEIAGWSSGLLGRVREWVRGKEGECVCGMLLNPGRRQRHHCLSGRVCWLFALSLCFVRECICVSGWGWSISSYMISDCVDCLSVPHRLWQLDARGTTFLQQRHRCLQEGLLHGPETGMCRFEQTPKYQSPTQIILQCRLRMCAFTSSNDKMGEKSLCGKGETYLGIYLLIIETWLVSNHLATILIILTTNYNTQATTSQYIKTLPSNILATPY